jgi:hypothetical protein
MSRKRGLRGFKRIAQFTDAQLALAQRGDDTQASGISKSFREYDRRLHISGYTDMFSCSQVPLNLNPRHGRVTFSRIQMNL